MIFNRADYVSMTDPIRLLHAVNDEEFAELTATQLRREDERFAITTVPNARSAQSHLAENDTDCIVSDYQMPDQNGITLLRTVREKFTNLPFILFTSKKGEAVASEAISAGVTDHFQKKSEPEQFELLANRIASAVENYRRQSTLERQSDLFTKTQELANVGAWEHNPVDGETYLTDEIYDIYEVDPTYEPDPEADIERFYHPDDRDTVREATSRAIEHGESYDIEVRITAADGSKKWVRTTGEPQVADGACVQIRGIVQDITDQKAREQELESEREFIETSFNTLNDIFYFLDTEGDLQRWNQTLPDVTGYTDDEIESMNALEFFDGEHQDAIDAAIHEILETGSNVVEAAITTTDGRQIPYEFRGVRMTDDGINPTGIIGIGRDITTRKEREADLKAQRDRLDEFSRTVSHDLRNPLSVAKGRLEILQAEVDSVHLDEAATAVNRSLTLIDDLLTLARDGHTTGRLEPVALAPLVTDCWAVIPGEEARMTVETNQTISADRSSLRQLLENLLANAVEHGGKDVTVTAGDLSDGFYIADDGVGIPEHEREKIFEVGYSRSDESTGFGLGIVKQIVDAHGWEIHGTESDDGGARIEITGVDIIE